jgi:hypothetical protein
VGDTACVGREGGSQRDHRRHAGARNHARDGLFKFLPKLVYSNESRHLVDWSIRGRLLRPHDVRSFHMGARHPGSDLSTDSGRCAQRALSARAGCIQVTAARTPISERHVTQPERTAVRIHPGFSVRLRWNPQQDDVFRTVGWEDQLPNYLLGLCPFVNRSRFEKNLIR